jgi:hypothetical protein
MKRYFFECQVLIWKNEFIMLGISVILILVHSFHHSYLDWRVKVEVDCYPVNLGQFGWKKQVVRLVKHSLWVRELMGISFPSCKYCFHLCQRQGDTTHIQDKYCKIEISKNIVFGFLMLNWIPFL